jgi:hypothetical protein
MLIPLYQLEKMIILVCVANGKSCACVRVFVSGWCNCVSVSVCVCVFDMCEMTSNIISID